MTARVCRVAAVLAAAGLAAWHADTAARHEALPTWRDHGRNGWGPAPKSGGKR